MNNFKKKKKQPCLIIKSKTKKGVCKTRARGGNTPGMCEDIGFSYQSWEKC